MGMIPPGRVSLSPYTEALTTTSNCNKHNHKMTPYFISHIRDSLLLARIHDKNELSLESSKERSQERNVIFTDSKFKRVTYINQ